MISTHLTMSEHAKIEAYLVLGYSIRRIPDLIGRHPSTVSREVNRQDAFKAESAQRQYEEQMSQCGAKSKYTAEIQKTV